MPNDGQPTKKLDDLHVPYLQRVACPVLAQETAYPLPACLLGANAVVTHPGDVTNCSRRRGLDGVARISRLASVLYACTVLLAAQNEEVTILQIVRCGSGVSI